MKYVVCPQHGRPCIIPTCAEKCVLQQARELEQWLREQGLYEDIFPSNDGAP